MSKSFPGCGRAGDGPSIHVAHRPVRGSRGRRSRCRSQGGSRRGRARRPVTLVNGAGSRGRWGRAREGVLAGRGWRELAAWGVTVPPRTVNSPPVACRTGNSIKKGGRPGNGVLPNASGESVRACRAMIRGALAGCVPFSSGIRCERHAETHAAGAVATLPATADGSNRPRRAGGGRLPEGSGAVAGPLGGASSGRFAKAVREERTSPQGPFTEALSGTSPDFRAATRGKARELRPVQRGTGRLPGCEEACGVAVFLPAGAPSPAYAR